MTALCRLLDWLRHKRRVVRWDHNRALGRRGEDIAHRFLQRKGFKIASRNYALATGTGEADIVAWDGSVLVFVEVKTRTHDSYGPPDRAIDREKRRHMLRVARAYSLKCSTPWTGVRLDVVNVVLSSPLQVDHIVGSLESGLWKPNADDWSKSRIDNSIGVAGGRT